MSRNLSIDPATCGVAADTPTCAARVTSGACPICGPYELGTWRWDHPSDVLQGCDRTRRIIGLADEEPREVFLERIDADDRDVVAQRLDAASADGQPFQLEFAVTIRGERRTIRMNGYRDAESPATLPQFFGTIEDITARRHTAQSLLELSLAVEQSRDHVCITDANGTIEYINPAWRESAARERAATGLPVGVLLGDPQVYVDARSAMDRGEIFRRTIRTTNGTTRYHDITMWPVRDENGDVARIVVISSDVTQQANAEEADARLQNALRDAAHEWRQTVDSIESAIVMFDPSGKIRRMNRAARELLGSRDYDLVGQTLSPQLPEPWPSVVALTAEAAQRGLGFQRQVRDDATERTWHIVGNVATHKQERDVVVVIRDITETVAMEDTLRRSEVMSAMGNLVAGVAHEVKNPLFGLTATLDAMELKFRRVPDAMRYTTMMRREVTRMNNLMRDLLDYGRALNLDLQPVIAGAVIASAVKLCRDAATGRGVKIANEIAPDFGVTRGDFSRLEQVFRNIIDNAIAFSNSGQTVTIRARYCDRSNRYIIEMCDEGPGFAQADLPHVFEPFFTRRKGGTGLGLSIVRRTVEEHGGRVVATNGAHGGALVRVELPAARK